MFVKAKLGPRWEYIKFIPDRDRVNYCFDILSVEPKYLNDERRTKQMIREALRQLEDFFSKGVLKGFDKDYNMNKGEVAVVEELEDLDEE